ncbi:EamA family transporter [Hassallia byssoidea VB512170]|uniref:EamA family transporter n=1 Tax=Hassallia byssoidea VB512170 TaxID=1304833 RepID=A0A846H4V4_9CYAN|nr:SMR family transporter [Hassalia byssoidea]NEU71629.1 EamA family transporter [Hassalia byssoidea VB512170]
MNAESSPSRLKLISYLTLFLSIAFGIVGQLLMKHTMSNKTEQLFTWTFIQQLVLALSVYSLGIVNWIFALRTVKLSIAYPLTSLNYVGILLGSYYFFDEKITLIRVVGVVLIFIGVLLVALPIKNSQIHKKAS